MKSASGSRRSRQRGRDDPRDDQRDGRIPGVDETIRGKGPFAGGGNRARESGIAGFDAEILPDNLPAMKVLHKPGFPVETIVAQGNYQLRVSFERPREQTTT